METQSYEDMALESALSLAESLDTLADEYGRSLKARMVRSLATDAHKITLALDSLFGDIVEEEETK